MKKLSYLYKLFLFLTIITVSCKKDILDIKPAGEFSDVDVWGDPALSQTFINNLYLGIPFGMAIYSGDVDENRSRQEAGFEIGNSLITPDNANNWGNWNGSYSSIRACNIALTNLVKVTFNDTAVKNRMIGEATFLRAWYYFSLTSFYGGVPLVTKVYGLTDSFTIARSSYADCIKFISDECDKAAALLPIVQTSENNGRATRGSALALKAETLLFAASDLHNPAQNSLVSTGFSNPELLGYTTADPITRWQAAKDAAKAVIDMGVYSLYMPSPANAAEASKNYAALFTSRTSVEDIQVRYLAAAIGQGYNGWEIVPNGWYGNGGVGATNEMVDAYEMNDGSKFDRTIPAESAQPYTNRDPRFYATVLYEGAAYRPRPADLTGVDPVGVMQVGTWQKWDNTAGKEVDIYGLDSRNSIANSWNNNTTGTTLLKFLDKTVDIQKTNQDLTWRYFRYGEVLLNYAEACIELGQYGEAQTYINMIRQRAGMPNVTETGSALRDRYRNERRIELAFEGRRFFDVRRWLIADQAYHPLHGVTVVYPLNPDHTTATIPTVTVVQIQLGAWDNKSYFFPIDRGESNKNNKLIQNPIYK